MLIGKAAVAPPDANMLFLQFRVVVNRNKDRIIEVVKSPKTLQAKDAVAP